MSTIDINTILLTSEMKQYAEVFTKNFHSNSSSTKLSTTRLKTLRLAHFPQLAITNYGHQKLLMKNIRAALANAESSTPLSDSMYIAEQKGDDVPEVDAKATGGGGGDLDSSIRKKPMKKRSR